ncbi:MAG: hypothetical protein GY861_27545 [bacterium]|nr:hypothetical protein [bacterium]
MSIDLFVAKLHANGKSNGDLELWFTKGEYNMKRPFKDVVERTIKNMQDTGSKDGIARTNFVLHLYGLGFHFYGDGFNPEDDFKDGSKLIVKKANPSEKYKHLNEPIRYVLLDYDPEKMCMVSGEL